MALGQQLHEARLARKETASQVAAATRMKVQIIEALETEDFSKIPAPIYGRGFIKLYAEHVGQDPQPMIQEYMTLTQSNGHFAQKRIDQNLSWLEKTVVESLRETLLLHPEVIDQWDQLKEKVSKDKITPVDAAEILLKTALRTKT